MNGDKNRSAENAVTGVEVLHVLWEGSGGGAERHVLDLAGGLRHRGVSTAVIYLASDGGAGEKLSAMSVAHQSLHLHGGGDPRGPIRVARAIRRFRPRVLHDHVSTPWLRAWLPARHGARVVATEHGHLLNPAYTRLRPRLLLERWSAARTDLYLAPSRALAGAVEQIYSFPPERIRVIPHGVSPFPWDGMDVQRAAARRETRQEAGIPEGSKVVLFLGRLDEEKGTLDLWAAFRAAAEQRKDLFLLVAGTGPLLGELRRRLAEPGAAGGTVSKIRLLGFCPDPAGLFAAADFLVLPSRNEGFGIVLLEAMAAGLPVIAARTGGIPEIVTPGRTGILAAPGKPAELTQAILDLAGNPEALVSLGRGGREEWARRFTLDRCIDSTLEAYQWIQERTRRI